MTNPILTPAVKSGLWYEACQRYKDGPLELGTGISSAREFVETLTGALDQRLQWAKSPLRLSLETDHSRYISTQSAGGIGVVKSLIVYDGAEPHIFDLTITPTLIRLGDRAIFIKHSLGAAQYLDAVLAIIEQVMTPDVSADN